MNKPAIPPEAARLIEAAELALIRAADGAEAIRLLTENYRSGQNADAARNAAGWAAAKLAADVQEATNALDDIHFPRGEVRE